MPGVERLVDGVVERPRSAKQHDEPDCRKSDDRCDEAELRGRPGTTSARVQLPQAVKRLSSLRLSKMFVPNSSRLYFGQSRPANRSTRVAECSLPWKMFGLQNPAGVDAPASLHTCAPSGPT